MHSADAAGDFLRLTEHYRQMKDPELLVLLRQSGELTDLARQALEMEVNHRRLKPEPEPEEPPPPIPEVVAPSHVDDSSYDEDRRLETVRTVWSLRDALQVQLLLDRAGIPFFLGPEKATAVATVTSDFTKGLDVQVMHVGIPWAAQALSEYSPDDEPAQAEPDASEEVPVRCPKCRSTEVVLNRLVNAPPPNNESEFPAADMEARESAADAPAKFDWSCDACGYRWQDDGIARN